ncbi:HisA/HisF-related TIM barrel protein [Vibrio lentus]|nr:HisA/HisF-related TIM barrel protein [Vibrio lentus]
MQRVFLSLNLLIVSINSPALANPQLITDLADKLACSVSLLVSTHTSLKKPVNIRFTIHRRRSAYQSSKWGNKIGCKVQKRGAGEIVLNMMNQDGVRNGYDIEQLNMVRSVCNVPLIASGGAGAMEHFAESL